MISQFAIRPSQFAIERSLSYFLTVFKVLHFPVSARGSRHCPQIRHSTFAIRNVLLAVFWSLTIRHSTFAIRN